MTETCLLEIVHGSRLYGTVHTESDLDIKSVWSPSAHDILVGRTDWSLNDTNGHRPNTKDDVDHERMDLLKFVRSLADGQAPLIEMLFAPEANHRVPAHPVIAMLVENIDLVVPCKPSRFLTYAEQAAPLFGVRSPRTEVAERVAIRLERLGPALESLKVSDVAELIVGELPSRFVSVGASKQEAGGQPLLFVCGKAYSFGASGKLVADAARRIADRPCVVEEGKEKDWVSIYHAVRFGAEALEFFEQGRIEFPRRDVSRLMDVRAGVVPDDEIADELRHLLDAVPRAATSSGLREAVDVEFLEQCVASVYAQKIRSAHCMDLSLDAFVSAEKPDL